MRLVRLTLLCPALILASSSALAWTLQTNEDEMENTTYSFIFNRTTDTSGFRWSNQAAAVFLLVDCHDEVAIHAGTNFLERSTPVTVRFDNGPKKVYRPLVHERQGSNYLVFVHEFGRRLLMESMKHSESLLVRFRERTYHSLLPPPTYIDITAAMSEIGVPDSTAGSVTSILGSIKDERAGYNTITLKFSLAGFTEAFEELKSVCGQ